MPRRCHRLGYRDTRRNTRVLRLDNVTIRQPRIRKCIGRILRNRLTEIINRTLQSSSVALVPIIAALQIELIRLSVARGFLCELFMSFRRKTDAELRRHIVGDLLLQGKKIRHRGMIKITPQLRLAVDVDQINLHIKDLIAVGDRARQHRADIQLWPDLLNIHPFAFEPKHCAAGNDPESGGLCKIVDDAFCEAVWKIFLFRRCTDIFERQYGEWIDALPMTEVEIDRRPNGQQQKADRAKNDGLLFCWGFFNNGRTLFGRRRHRMRYRQTSDFCGFLSFAPQFADHVGNGLITILRNFLERASYDAFKFRWKIGQILCQRRRFLIHDRINHRGLVFTTKRELAGQHLEEKHAERKDIASIINFAPLNLFGSHVA